MSVHFSDSLRPEHKSTSHCTYLAEICAGDPVEGARKVDTKKLLNNYNVSVHRLNRVN